MKQGCKEARHIELINAIHAEKRRRQWNLADLGRHLGISHVYMSSLSNGARQLSSLKIEKQRKLARFLGMSLVDLQLECGTLTPADFTKEASMPEMEGV